MLLIRIDAPGWDSPQLVATSCRTLSQYRRQAIHLEQRHGRTLSLATPADYRGVVRKAESANRAFRSALAACNKAVEDREECRRLDAVLQASIDPADLATWNLLNVIKAKKMPLTKSMLRRVPSLKAFTRIRRMAKQTLGITWK